MTVFKDRNLVLTGKKNGVSVRGSTVEGDTFGMSITVDSGAGLIPCAGIKKLEFKPAGTTSASTKPKSKLCQQLALPSPADDGFSAPQQTPFTSHTRTSLGGVDSTPLPSATRSRRRSRHSFTPLRPSPQQADQAREMASTPAPVRMAPGSGGPSSFRFPSSSSVSNLLAPAALDNKSFITPARPSYRAYLSPPEYEMDGEDEDISGRDESFEMGEMRNRMGALGVVDENEGEMMMDAEVQGAGQMDAAVESDGEVEYMPPKVVGESRDWSPAGNTLTPLVSQPFPTRFRSTLCLSRPSASSSTRSDQILSSPIAIAMTRRTRMSRGCGIWSWGNRSCCSADGRGMRRCETP